MKKPTPWATAQSEYETRIRQDERLIALAGLWKHIHLLDKRFVDLAKGLDELKAYIPHPPKDEPHRSPYPTDPTPKRKAVTADGFAVESVGRVLTEVRPIGTLLTIKQVWEACPEGIGLKRVGAALRLLATDHHAIEAKRGKWRAPEQPSAETADGATSEAP